MKLVKILYWTFTSLLSLSILAGAALYFVDYQHASNEFTTLGFPIELIYPLAIAKILGIVGIIQKVNTVLKEWAYSGLFFNIALAFFAHFVAEDGEAFGPILVLLFLIGSYVFGKKRIKKELE